MTSYLKLLLEYFQLAFFYVKAMIIGAEKFRDVMNRASLRLSVEFHLNASADANAYSSSTMCPSKDGKEKVYHYIGHVNIDNRNSSSYFSI